MKTKEIVDGNKLIAEFLGIQPVYADEYEMYQVIQAIKDGEDEKHFFTPQEMLFDSDWSWIMEVVDEIDHLGANVTMTRMLCDIKYQDPLNAENVFKIRIACGVKINAVYGAVVEFIKWYNDRFPRLVTKSPEIDIRNPKKKAEMYIISVTTADEVGDSGYSLQVDEVIVRDNLEDAVDEYNSALQKESLFSATLSAVILSTDYPTDPSMQWLADEIISK
jgi:hypothetical protein